MNHEEEPLPPGTGVRSAEDRQALDSHSGPPFLPRELTMSQLEVTINTSTGISESPLQLKSNSRTLVIDDFAASDAHRRVA